MKSKLLKIASIVVMTVAVSVPMAGAGGPHETLNDLEVGSILGTGYEGPILSSSASFREKDKILEMDKNVRAYQVIVGLMTRGGFDPSDEFEGMPGDQDKKEKSFWDSLFGKNTPPSAAGLNFETTMDRYVAARKISGDVSDLVDGGSWRLVPEELSNLTELRSEKAHEKVRKLALRFDLAPEKLQKFLEIVAGSKNEEGKGLELGLLVPLWSWENAPYLHQRKLAFMKGLAKDLVEYIADSKVTGMRKILLSIKDWIKTTKIQGDIEEYLRPKKVVKAGQAPHLFKPEQMKKSKVDVNKIDVGVEYSGRFPTVPVYNFTKKKLADGKKHWMETRIGITQGERQDTIREVAQSLSQRLGNEDSVKVKLGDEGSHGHGMSIAYYVADPKGGKWRVEWDGITRSYNLNGKILPDSGRAGIIELVTPKFNPEFSEMQAVEKAFKDNDIIPTSETGGGHVNVDLAAFKGKPKEMARFLATFHEYRGIVSLMFQNEARLKSALPARVSAKLANILKNFDKITSEEELKKHLYNERYFNTRLGRKTRYQQIDLTNYFQDVVPPEFIHDDYDILSPTLPWRPQFRVDSKIRKMEMRLMDAPKDAYMSGLQMKLVRALLNKAFNSSSPLTGTIQTIDYKKYVKNPAKAFEDLKKLTDDLGLSFEEYKGYVAAGIRLARSKQSMNTYSTISERLKENPELEIWGKAVPARDYDKGLSYKERKWVLEDGVQTRTPLLKEVQSVINKNRKVLQQLENQREEFQMNPPACFRRSGPPSSIVGINGDVDEILEHLQWPEPKKE